jgi:hypothetical protein
MAQVSGILSGLGGEGQGETAHWVRQRQSETMKELLRTNDPVLLSFVSALLEGADIAFIVLDTNMSVMEGSIGILPRRVLVEEDRMDQARNLLTEAGVGHDITDKEKS